MDATDLAVAAATIRRRWPHAVLYRDDIGDLWIENDGDWVAKLDTNTGQIRDRF